MKKHPVNGRDIIAGSGGNFPGAMDVAHSHHERIDGHGYPRGLYDHQTTLWSKIVSVTDAFDAEMAKYDQQLIKERNAMKQHMTEKEWRKAFGGKKKKE